MKTLFRFEFRKLVRQKSFYICTAVMLGLALLGLLITKLAVNGATEENPVIVPSVLSLLLTAINSTNYILISGIFIVLFVSTDFNQETIKNVYARGFSSWAVYITKYVVCVVAALAMLIVSTLFTLAVGAIMFNGEAQSGNYAGLLVGQVLYCITNVTFAFALSYIFKKVGSSIALYILGPGIVNLGLALFDALFKFDESFKLVNYWFGNFGNDLMSLTTSASRLIICIVFSIIYTAAFFIAGRFIKRKKESN